MPLPAFSSWLQRRNIKPSEADRIIPLIAQAGSKGMSRGEIGRATTLDREVLDEFLDGLVQVGVVQVDVVNGIRLYRAASAWRA